MICQVCGQEALENHSCPASAPPSGFAFGYYLSKAWRIVRWNDDAIRDVMNDPRALRYGLLVWIATNTLSVLAMLFLWPNQRDTIPNAAIPIVVVIALVYSAVLSLIQLGIVHLIAKYFCAGNGKFVQILRPLLLVSFVYILQVIPVAGTLIAGLAWVCVMVMVFDVVDEMDQLTCFLVSAAVGIALRFVTGGLFHSPI